VTASAVFAATEGRGEKNVRYYKRKHPPFVVTASAVSVATERRYYEQGNHPPYVPSSFASFTIARKFSRLTLSGTE
jgi:hypothetical protein